jgi:hypothetical protein
MERNAQRLQRPDEVSVAALADKSRTPIDVVRHIYDEELAELDSKSTVKNFIEVIAGRRVKERLRRGASDSEFEGPPGDPATTVTRNRS